MQKVKIIRKSNGKTISKAISKTKPLLTKHIVNETINEYYTYIDANGVEQKYVGIISKSGDSFFGKTFEQHKVNLTYYPGVKHVVGNPEYYTYVDSKGNICKYYDTVQYDEVNSCYIGKIPTTFVTNVVIDIFEEK